MDQTQAKGAVTFIMVALGLLVLTSQGFLKQFADWVSGQTHAK